MDCGYESFHNAKVIMDGLGWGTKQLMVQEVLVTILSGLSYFWIEMMTLLAPHFKWVTAFFLVMKIPVDSTTYLVPVYSV